MANVKEAIEEVIEESYLLNLTAEEIRRDFEKFIDTCFLVIKSQVQDRDTLAGLNKELAREKTCVLIAEHDGVRETTETSGGSDISVPISGFAEKVARRKCLILKAIAEIDPKLVRLIDEQRFGGDFPDESKRKIKNKNIKSSINREQLRTHMLQIGYGVTVAVIVLLMYLGLSLNP